MDRKTLVESAFQKLALGTEEQRFLAIRDLKKALEAQPHADYRTEVINLYIIFIEILDNLGQGRRNIIDFFDKIDYQGIRTFCDRNSPNGLFPYGIGEFLTQKLPEIWLKSLKYDAFIEQFSQIKEELQLKKQELSLLEQFFDAIEPKEPKLLE